jgi:diguanylate cyclase (GGDEF)-like protein
MTAGRSVPAVVLEAEGLVRGLGGTLVPAWTVGPDVVPVDLSFGGPEPRYAAAPAGSPTRALLDEHLATFLLDAHRSLELGGQVVRLAEEASTDALTGLPNRRMLLRALARLTGNDVVILLDLDHFKRVNDEFGHAAGDDVLRAFGRVLRASVRGRDVVGRFGGEEFLVVITPPAGAEHLLRRLRALWLEERSRPVTFSAGLAHAAGGAEPTLAQADEALYRAKAGGRDRWEWAA